MMSVVTHKSGTLGMFCGMWKSISFIADSKGSLKKAETSEQNLDSEARSGVVTRAPAQRKCKTKGLIVSDSIGSHNNVIFCCLWRMPLVYAWFVAECRSYIHHKSFFVDQRLLVWAHLVIDIS